MPFDGHYDGWRNARLAFLLRLGPFKGKRVLELGCGYAHFGDLLAQEGAIVTGADARQEHIDWVRNNRPSVAPVLADLDQAWSLGDSWDLILHMGVLYHLADPEMHLRELCKVRATIVLETEVYNSPDPLGSYSINEEGYDQAFNGVGTRLSPANIERILADCGRDFMRIDSRDLNYDYHSYDWHPADEPEYRSGLRRFWIITQ